MLRQKRQLHDHDSKANLQFFWVESVIYQLVPISGYTNMVLICLGNYVK